MRGTLDQWSHRALGRAMRSPGGYESKAASRRRGCGAACVAADMNQRPLITWSTPPPMIICRAPRPPPNHSFQLITWNEWVLEQHAVQIDGRDSARISGYA